MTTAIEGTKTERVKTAWDAAKYDVLGLTLGVVGAIVGMMNTEGQLLYTKPHVDGTTLGTALTGISFGIGTAASAWLAFKCGKSITSQAQNFSDKIYVDLNVYFAGMNAGLTTLCIAGAAGLASIFPESSSTAYISFGAPVLFGGFNYACNIRNLAKTLKALPAPNP